MTEMSDIAISVKNVGKRYQVFDSQSRRLLHAFFPARTKGLQEIWALKNVSFDIRRGEAVAIIGRNGGGKSTLLEILTGTLTQTTGSVTVNGRVNALLELGSGFNPEYTGRDNVILNGLLLGLSREEILSRFDEIAAFSEIGPAIDWPVKTYSSGMMMRLAFAVQVMTDPDILIIDEALSVGDFFFQQKCMSYIRGLCDKGVTLLFVSHDMGAVRDICQRGIFLDKGVISFDGENTEAIRRYLNDKNSVVAPESILPQGLKTAKAAVDRAYWQANDSVIGKLAEILYVEILDLYGSPITSVRLGDVIVARVHYRIGSADSYSVNLEIQDKHKNLVTSISSHNLKLAPPVRPAGEEIVFEISLKMAVEAGRYAICFSLGKNSDDGTTGVVIDSTSWIGPFEVTWDYNNEIPPFYGMVGLDCSGKFVEV